MDPALLPEGSFLPLASRRGVPFSGFFFCFSGSSFSVSSLIDFSNACTFQSVKSGPPLVASPERPHTFRGSPRPHTAPLPCRELGSNPL